MITQLIIDSNCSISVITGTWLTIGDSALASQLSPDGFKYCLQISIYLYILIYIYIYIYISHRRSGLSMLFSSELKLISSSTPCFSSHEILIRNIQFPSFTIISILIYRPPSSSLWSLLADLSSILESYTSVNTVILCDFNIQINNEHHASLSLNKRIFEYSLTQYVVFNTNTNSNNIDFFLYLADSNLISYPTQSSLISDHFAILFDFNLPVIQINRLSRSFQKISSINNQCVLTLYSINLATVYLLICLHFLIILIWHYLIRLIFWYPPLLLSAELIISFPGLISSLLT